MWEQMISVEEWAIPKDSVLSNDFIGRATDTQYSCPNKKWLIEIMLTNKCCSWKKKKEYIRFGDLGKRIKCIFYI